MPEEKYFLISCGEGEPQFEEITKEEILERLEDEEDGSIEAESFMVDGGINEDMNYWGNNKVLIKGRIIKPKGKEVAVKYEID